MLQQEYSVLSWSIKAANKTREIAWGRQMASYQQRIPLKGTEESIDFFTNVLKATKVCNISDLNRSP